MQSLSQILGKMGGSSPAHIPGKRRRDVVEIWNEEKKLLANMTAEEAAQYLKRRCPYCGDVMTPYEYWRGGLSGGMWRFRDRHGCRPEADFLDNQDRTEQVRAVGLRRDRLHRAGLIGWLEKAAFDTYEPRRESPAAASWGTTCREYAAGLITGQIGPEKNWLVMYGDYGMGKSHLAAAILRDVIDAGRWGYFRVWPKYLERLQASWNSRGEEAETEEEILAELNGGWMVVIDDIDKKVPTEFSRQSIFGFLNARYNAGLPTVITLNQDAFKQDPHNGNRYMLEQYIGPAAVDRVIERLWNVIEFRGPSYRSGVQW